MISINPLSCVKPAFVAFGNLSRVKQAITLIALAALAYKSGVIPKIKSCLLGRVSLGLLGSIGFGQTFNQILLEAAKYPFTDYKISKIGEQDPEGQYASASSFGPMQAYPRFIQSMTYGSDSIVPYIGKVKDFYRWASLNSASQEAFATLGRIQGITGARVSLTDRLSIKEFNEHRKCVQQQVFLGDAAANGADILKIAKALGGVTIEATLPYRADVILKEEGKASLVDIHCIFQSGLNFNGYYGGGIPLIGGDEQIPKDADISALINNYTLANARSAVQAAIRNKSEVLVFNLGIGTGFFGGRYGPTLVKQANVDTLAQAAQEAKESALQIVVPNVGLIDKQKGLLEAAGIKIVEADKGAVAALCARKGLQVSETIAADPMSMLGIHGPGFWWRSAGSASDEERIAFLTPCYLLGYIPIDVYPNAGAEEGETKIAAMSEFMMEDSGRLRG